MGATSFYSKVVSALDDIDAPYMLVGAFAGLSFGMTRTTFDMDIVVALRESDFEALAQEFLLPRYYADPEMMRDSVQQGVMFNIIDTEEAVKADFVPLVRKPELTAAFERRIRRKFVDPSQGEFEAWCAGPEDIIIGKLEAWIEGRSAKHPSDILDILTFALENGHEPGFDQELVSKAARDLGPEAMNLWQELLTKAKRELGGTSRDSERAE